MWRRSGTLENKYQLVTLYRGVWGSISNYGWQQLCDVYYSIAKNMEYYREYNKEWKDREFTIVRQQSGNTARIFTAPEAYALGLYLEKLEYGYIIHPSKVEEVCKHLNISKRKFSAMGKRIFNEVKWNKCYYEPLRKIATEST